ncbi:MAG TPA: hypothetical protein DCS82_10445 [Rhodospirillaceae bacterium]|nr:hypothetical protein [Rhodospirillaceae bacterium]
MSEELTPTEIETLRRMDINALVVDDQEYIRHIVRQFLRTVTNGVVLEAGDGAEAMAFLEPYHGQIELNWRNEEYSQFGEGGKKIDCIVTDFKMAPMNGLEMLQKIRSGNSAADPDLPVIMLTGFNDQNVIGAALELDVTAFIVKPVSQSALHTRLYRALSKKIAIRPSTHYDAIATDGVSPVSTDGAAGKDAAAGTAAGGSELSSTTVTLAEVPLGAILVKDIVTLQGSVLIKAGTAVTEDIKDRLGDLAGHKDVPLEVMVAAGN